MLSDYAKGVLTARVIRHVIDTARKLGKRMIVDPKSANLAIYRGATLAQAQRQGIRRGDPQQCSIPIRASPTRAQDIMQLADCEAVLVTQSEHGMTLVPRHGDAIHVPGHPVKVRDVSGAGDTVAAALAVTLAAGADWETSVADGERRRRGRDQQAGRRGGDLGGIAPQDPAACVPRRRRKRSWLRPMPSWTRSYSEWRKQGLRIGFTNGCFDILHPGHVKLLTAARGTCDRLIVGLNSDASVKRLKGEGRPVQNERARAEVLAALEAVDLVVVFEEDTPLNLITTDQAERAGQGRRLHPRAGGRPRDRRSLWRRGAAGRYPAGLQHHRAGGNRARGRPVMSTGSGRFAGRRGAAGLARSALAWAKTADITAVLVALSLPWSTSLLGDLRGGVGDRRWLPTIEPKSFLAIAEAADLRASRWRWSRWR